MIDEPQKTNDTEIRNSEQEEIFSNFLKDKFFKNKNTQIYDLDITGKKSNKDIIKNANNEFLLKVLSPQIIANEEKKRQHKDWLMIIMGAFLIFQFMLVAIMISYCGYWIIHMQIINNPFSDSTIKIMITFICTYVTSIIIELIAILKYIVKNVFDTSISGMVKIFKDKKDKSSDN